jgi:predicted GNAT family N-acyltransferase
VDVDAQTYAIPFYHTFGFAEYGEEFLDAGMPHKKMKLKL